MCYFSERFSFFRALREHSAIADTDGPYEQAPCGSTTHEHHKDLLDSQARVTPRCMWRTSRAITRALTWELGCSLIRSLVVLQYSYSTHSRFKQVAQFRDNVAWYQSLPSIANPLSQVCAAFIF
jgi:hypothetical protein